MTDENDGFERTGLMQDMLRAMDGAGNVVINWGKPTKMLEITPEREVVFFGPDGFETWRVPFDVLSDVLRVVIEEYGP